MTQDTPVDAPATITVTSRDLVFLHDICKGDADLNGYRPNIVAALGALLSERAKAGDKVAGMTTDAILVAEKELAQNSGTTAPVTPDPEKVDPQAGSDEVPSKTPVPDLSNPETAAAAPDPSVANGDNAAAPTGDASAAPATADAAKPAG